MNFFAFQKIVETISVKMLQDCSIHLHKCQLNKFEYKDENNFSNISGNEIIWNETVICYLNQFFSSSE